MSDETNPLELFTADELVDELARRNAGVVVGIVNDRTDKEEGFQCWFRGGFTLALGLAALIQRDLLDKKPDVHLGGK